MIIGLTGGIAAGKSHVAAIFEKYDCAVFDADRVAKSFLNDPDVINRIGLLGIHPPTDRKALANLLFVDHKARSALERVVHPKVNREMLTFIDSQRGFRHVVLDVPLLFEKGLQDYCDIIVFLYSPYNVRLARAAKRGWSLEDFLSREQCQFPVNQKERMSDVVLPSYEESGADLDAAVRRLLKGHD